MMKKEELNELFSELKVIYRALLDEKDLFENLTRLTICISKLKNNFLLYSQIANRILDQIQSYINDIAPLSYIICDVELLIVEIDKDLKKDSITTSLKNGCEKAKAKIPEDIKSIGQNVEKKIKATIKNLLLSE